jgi:IS30 family transposase
MSKNYHQLSSEQRYQIEALIKAGSCQKEIAIILKVHPSTICRELKRNTPKRGKGALEYKAVNAQRRTNIRHDKKPKANKFTADMRQYAVSRLINERYSPELIEVMGRRELGYFVSRETLYKWIWDCKKSNHRKDRMYKKLYEYLAHGRRRRKRGLRHDSRGIIPGRVSIENRPAVVAKRKRVGDIEVDLMMGKSHKGALLVMTDRTTLLTKLALLKGKEAQWVYEAAIRKLKQLKEFIKTLTFDNDKAFSKHLKIGKILDAKTYFTRPYTSQDKGTVENRIGLIRRFLPKQTDLRNISQQLIRRIETLINNRPVRKFNYKTPNQVFSNKIALIS